MYENWTRVSAVTVLCTNHYTNMTFNTPTNYWNAPTVDQLAPCRTDAPGFEPDLDYWLRFVYCLFAGRILAFSQGVVGFSNCCGFPFLVIIRTPTTLPLYADCVLISGNILEALFIHVAPILVMAVSEGLEPPRRIIDEQVSNLRQYQLCLTHQWRRLWDSNPQYAHHVLLVFKTSSSSSRITAKR